jgi:hypothetical protein
MESPGSGRSQQIHKGMTRSIDCRVLVTAIGAKAGRPETDSKMAAPVLTDPEKHRALIGPLESADGSQATIGGVGQWSDLNGCYGFEALRASRAEGESIGKRPGTV